MPITVAERCAASILALEGVALFVLAGWEIVALVSGDSESAVSSIGLIVLTVLGAAAVVAFAVAVWRGSSWGRSGGIVTQLLALAVVFGALSGPTPQHGFAVTVGLPALVALVLLIAGTRAAGRRVRETD